MSRSYAFLNHCTRAPVAVLYPLILFVVLAVSASGAEESLQECVQFKVPPPKSIIPVPVCTLGVDSSCRPIKITEIMVRYFPAGSESAIIDTIAHLDRSPFRYAWNLTQIPNQLAIGIGVLIEVTFADGEVYGARREGIFLAHKPVDYPSLKAVSYDYPGTVEFPKDTIQIPMTDSAASAFARMYWNENGLVARISVLDPRFDSSKAAPLLDRMGIELLIDPLKYRLVFPSEDVLILSVPLAGKTARLTYQPTFNDDGTFQLNLVKTSSHFNHYIEIRDHNGFTVTCTVPAFFFGKALPREMGFNIVVRSVDTGNRIVTSSLIHESGYNNYSPFIWPVLATLPQPISKVGWIVWLACFLAGLAASLLFCLISASLAKESPYVILSKQPDQEREEFAKIKEVIDRSILQPWLSVDGIANELQMPPNRLKAAVRRATGMPLKLYAMYLREEVVYERLRSSDSTEEAITKSCGFLDVKEMRRYFQQFYRISPFNFRKAQQITTQE